MGLRDRVWTTGLFETNLLPQHEMALLFPEMLVYAGIILFIAGLFLYRRDNTFFGEGMARSRALQALPRIWKNFASDWV